MQVVCTVEGKAKSHMDYPVNHMT